MIFAMKGNHSVCDFQPLEVIMLRDTDLKGLALQHPGQVLLQWNGRELSGISSHHRAALSCDGWKKGSCEGKC